MATRPQPRRLSVSAWRSGAVINVFHSAVADFGVIAGSAKPPPEELADRAFDASTRNGYRQFDYLIRAKELDGDQQMRPRQSTRSPRNTVAESDDFSVVKAGRAAMDMLPAPGRAAHG